MGPIKILVIRQLNSKINYNLSQPYFIFVRIVN